MTTTALIGSTTRLNLVVDGAEPLATLYHGRYKQFVPRRVELWLSSDAHESRLLRMTLWGPALKKDGTPAKDETDAVLYARLDGQNHLDASQTLSSRDLSDDQREAFLRLVERIDEAVHPTVLLTVGAAATHIEELD